MSDKNIFAAGLGLSTISSNGDVLETFYQKVFVRNDTNATPVDDFVKICADSLGYDGGNSVINLGKYDFDLLIDAFSEHEGTIKFLQAVRSEKERVVITIFEEDVKANSVEEVYLKLSLLSHRLRKPHEVNLDGIFGLLPNVAWTSEGAISQDDLPDRQLQARMNNSVLVVRSVDKFPPMTDYVVPSGVRIADTSRVRLGAHVGEGTTVMHEGFINFNAGTAGVSMVEGRISAGVMVGEGSDIGGGASIMGTLSGGGKEVITIGENSLLGANAGLGFPLGDRCTIESGLYVTAGSKVVVLDDEGNQVTIVKASDLANKDDLLFRRNSLTGQIECLANKSAVELNSMLHSN